MKNYKMRMSLGPGGASDLGRQSVRPGFQKWLLQHFMDTPGKAKMIGVHVPPIGPYPAWTDGGKLLQGVKTYPR